VRFALSHLKRYLHNRIQPFDILSEMIACGIEGQPVKPRAKSLVLRKQLPAPAFSIRA
jgi:hypothetical protein